MPLIDSLDSIEIHAPAQDVFRVVLDYPRFHEWFPAYHCRLLDGDEVQEGARIEHTIGMPPYLVFTRFVRTIRRIVPGERIEETYDEGDLTGTGAWSFQQKGETTIASFHCRAKSVALSLHISFFLTGSLGHKMVFRKLLQALKRRCEEKKAAGSG